MPVQKELYRRFHSVKRKLADCLPDFLYINLLYRKTYGRFPNLRNPRTFDEKLQWYKLYFRHPIMTRLSDKYEVRSYVTEKGLSGILNELYGVYDSASEIDPSGLPEHFVIKATNGSGMNLICRDKNGLDWEECRRIMDDWLQTNYYRLGREWAYKNVRPRLICEKYLENPEFGELIDYKFYCYNGKPEIVFVCTGRFSSGGLKYDAFDLNWDRVSACKGRPRSDLGIGRPANFPEMVETVRQLCGGFPFIRVDLYLVEAKIIFGELTFYPDNGLIPFTPDSFNYYFGDLFRLPGRRTRSCR
jgi:hypothetical protein